MASNLIFAAEQQRNLQEDIPVVRDRFAWDNPAGHPFRLFRFLQVYTQKN